jgi:hypothetical protein
MMIGAYRKQRTKHPRVISFVLVRERLPTRRVVPPG